MNTEQYKGQDLNGDGEEDYAICQPNQGDMAFYSLYAPLLGLLQTHNEEHVEVKSQIFPKRHVSVKRMYSLFCTLSDNTYTHHSTLIPHINTGCIHEP